jgi:hypothetical protein
MPTIELTDEQAEELMDLVADKMGVLARKIDFRWNIGDEALELKHIRSVLSDILHLLEIA